MSTGIVGLITVNEDATPFIPPVIDDIVFPTQPTSTSTIFDPYSSAQSVAAFNSTNSNSTFDKITDAVVENWVYIVAGCGLLLIVISLLVLYCCVCRKSRNPAAKNL